MKTFTQLLAYAAVAATAAGGASVSAGQPYDPNVARIANPANVCKSIPATIAFDAALLGMPAPDLSWFNYQTCVRTLAQGKAVVEPVEPFGNPYEQCDALVGDGAFTYPATLHSGEGGEEDQLLPDLTVRNRKGVRQRPVRLPRHLRGRVRRRRLTARADPKERSPVAAGNMIQRWTCWPTSTPGA